MVAQTTSAPCSASKRHSRALRIADRRRSLALWPRSSAITARSASPSRKVTGRPAARSRLHSSRPTVVLPAPDKLLVRLQGCVPPLLSALHNQHPRQALHGFEPLPAQSIDPVLKVAQH